MQAGDVAELRDCRHALGGEHAAALQLPVLVLLQQHRPHQAGDRGVVGEDSNDAGASFDFLVHPLQQVGAPDLAPVLLGALVNPGHVLQQVAGEVDQAALPNAALQLVADCLGEPYMGVRDHQLDASEAPRLEVGVGLAFRAAI